MFGRALRRIRDAERSGVPALDLSRLGLTALPDALARLTHLTELNVSGNRLTDLPGWLGELTALTELRASGNRLTAPPEPVARLTGLTRLVLSGNALTALPDWIAGLAALRDLALIGNQLEALPDALGDLASLTHLDVSYNRLTALPETVGRLSSLLYLSASRNLLEELPETLGALAGLRTLQLGGNRLARLPESLGRLGALTRLDLTDNALTGLPAAVGALPALEVLGLDANPLASPPPAVVAAGTEAVLAYLRDGGDAVRQWRSKLLLVGEGGVGKTSLLKALTGQAPQLGEQSTHGLNIEGLTLAHPADPDVPMELSVWDFGGQHVYHATHQFFFTDQSLFLLVWNARTGWAPSKGRYWLDVIAARTRTAAGGPAAPVLLVATHCGDRAPDLPWAELLRDHPNIVGRLEVDTFADGETGLSGLRARIAEAAARLPLMGSAWPAVWLAAQRACRDSPDSHLRTDRFDDLLVRAGVADAAGRRAVTGVLHQLGEVLHYAHDPDLSGTVVLKPQWLSERIAAVLDSPDVAARHGLLTAADLAARWSDVDPELRAQLLY